MPKEARCDYLINGEDQIQSWYLGDEHNGDLSSVRFYDRYCGEAYVMKASEVDYRPSALLLMDQLDAVCRAVDAELENRLQRLDREKSDFPPLHEGTTAHRFVTELSEETSESAIEEICSLPEDHAQALSSKLSEQARLSASSPASEKARLSTLASKWTIVGEHTGRIWRALSTEGVQALTDQRNKARTLREAANAASAANFEGEPLEGVGSDAWRKLWAAARDYSIMHAYPDHEFPNNDDGAHCVLCQQRLGEDGRDRLSRFHAYMMATTEREAEEAEEELRGKREEIIALRELPAYVAAALNELRNNSDDTGWIESWLSSGVDVAEGVATWLEDGGEEEPPSGLGDDPRALINQRVLKLERRSEGIDEAGFAEQQSSIAREVLELQSRSALASASDQVKAEVQRLRRRAAIENARSKTDTTGITRQKTELTKRYVTTKVRDHFAEEARGFRVSRVTLDPTGGRKEVSLEHKPKLADAKHEVPINVVLSEGEQTALGLAGFQGS